MNTTELIKIMISNNIKNSIDSEYEIINIDKFNEFINSKIDINKINDILNFDKDKYTDSQCCARVWRKSIHINDTKYEFKKVDSRCSFKGIVKINNYHYCKKHYNQLQKKGYLRLLRHDEECPEKDIIGYQDHKYIYGNKRVWYDNFNEQLDTLLRYHNKELKKLVLYDN